MRSLRLAAPLPSGDIDCVMRRDQLGSSRQRYKSFVEDYKLRRLDEKLDERRDGKRPGEPDTPVEEEVRSPWWRFRRGKRREYLRDYLRWLKPHRTAVVIVFLLALLRAGLEMIEPLFMRFIVDRVLLNEALDAVSRISRLNLAGATFLTVIILSNFTNAAKDYWQCLLNVRVMLSLRRALFHRMLPLPLAKVWDMKTGGVLSRITGDVDTTTGL